MLVAPPALLNWSGFYVGLNVGYALDGGANSSTSGYPSPINPAFPTGGPYTAMQSAAGLGGSGAGKGGQFLGGGQIGYNWQPSSVWVGGLEADIQGLAGKTTSNITGGAPLLGAFPDLTTYLPGEAFVSSAAVSKRLSYLATVRGRWGYLIAPSLLGYITGGLAVGGVSGSAGILQTNNDINFFALHLNPVNGTSGSMNTTRVGWTVGAGLEWMFASAWSAKLEYLYYDLGNVSYAIAPLYTTANYVGGAFTAATPRIVSRYNGHIVRAGVNYHFNWGAPAAVVAKY